MQFKIEYFMWPALYPSLPTMKYTLFSNIWFKTKFMWLIVKDEKLWGKTLLVKWSTTWILFTFKLTTITLFGFLCSVHSALLLKTPLHCTVRKSWGGSHYFFLFPLFFLLFLILHFQSSLPLKLFHLVDTYNKNWALPLRRLSLFANN